MDFAECCASVVQMSRVHDMGGQAGFGPVPAGRDEQQFPADWEMRVAALSTALMRRGTFTGDEFRDAIERIPPADYLAMSYYERWLVAVELLLAEKELLAGQAQAAGEGQPAGDAQAPGEGQAAGDGQAAGG
jgi:nitrile hydratase subunit beta